MRRWNIETEWEHYGQVIFTVFDTGIVSEVSPADSPLRNQFSSIEGFDLPGANSAVDRAAVSIGEAVHGHVNVVGCTAVFYPLRGPGQYINAGGVVTAISETTSRG